MSPAICRAVVVPVRCILMAIILAVVVVMALLLIRVELKHIPPATHGDTYILQVFNWLMVAIRKTLYGGNC